MSETRFTPGPWFAYVASGMAIVLSNPLDGPCMASAPKADTIASWSGTYDQEKHHWNLSGEVAANARLIAAAPQMYEALKSVLSIPGITKWGEADKAIAALALAEGKDEDSNV